MGKYVIHSSHHVFIILDSPSAPPRRPEEILAVSGRTARISVEHRVPPGSEELQLEIEIVAIRAVWAAVNRNNQWQALGRLVGRQEKPAFDLRSILAAEQQSRGRIEPNGAQKRRIHARELLFAPR